MNPVVADTNAVLWYFFDPRQLSSAADAALSSASRIIISAMTVVEVICLSRKSMFEYPGALTQLRTLVASSGGVFEFAPLTVDVALAVQLIAYSEIPDMPDRIISATAVAHNLPLVTSDRKIRSSASLAAIIPVIW